MATFTTKNFPQNSSQINPQSHPKNYTQNHPQNNLQCWSHVPYAPGDAILGLTESYLNDKNSQKVNLGVGAYKDENGKPWVLPSIMMAEKLRIGDIETSRSRISHEYLPLGGNQSLVTSAIRFAYGEEICNKKSIAALQTISGSGAVRLAAEFLTKYKKSSIFIPSPSWPVHFSIFDHLKFDVQNYRYWNNKDLCLDFNGLLTDMNNAPNGSLFILHACAHNPTGCDPTKEQWMKIEEVFKAKNHFPFFDMAYQGFATGDPDEDAWPVRYFVESGQPVLLCQSFAKNMGLYGQRTGTLSLVCNNEDEKERCFSQLKSLARILYSTPPRFGSEIAASVFNNPKIFKQWKEDILVMSSRVRKMREELYSLLKTKGVVWNHILNQKGMFAYTGLSSDQVSRLINEFHIYLTKDGRISIPGLNESNIQYVADCFALVYNN